ncbi:MAG: caspase family protein [Rhizobiaceae bacterium]
MIRNFGGAEGFGLHDIRSWQTVIAVCVLLLASVVAAGAETLRGHALVVGQSDYEHLSKLPNPANDAQAVSGLLEQLGFSVQLAENRNAAALTGDLDAFVEESAGADVALVYFSGHGVEAGGENFLLPTDADPAALDATGGNLVALSSLLKPLQAQAKIVIVLVDACRTNPFPDGTMVRTATDPDGVAIGEAGLGLPRGMTVLSGDGGNENLGLVIGFAAEPGRVALDGEPGGNSPYAAALLKHFAAGERQFSDLMTMVTEEVYLKTRARQRPWTNASLRRFLYFGGSAEQMEGDEAELRGARRELLLRIASVPKYNRNYVESLAERDGLPLDALYGMLAELQVDTSAGPAKIGQQLRAGAANLKRILEKTTPSAEKDPELVRLTGLAVRAESEGLMRLARRFRAEASARADELVKALDESKEDSAGDRLELASVYAGEADTAVLMFDFDLAADGYLAAFEQAKKWDEAQAFRYKVGEAEALTSLGRFAGDRDLLEDAITAYGEALEMVSRRKNPLDWAEATNNLAGVHVELANLEESAESLQTALKLYQQALKRRPRKLEPVLWGKTQNNIAVTHLQIAYREEGTRSLKRALKAFRQALEVFTSESEPAFHASVHTNMGDVFRNLGLRGTGTSDFEKGVKSLKIALEYQSIDKDPYIWSITQTNLGNTYLFWGERERDREILALALEAYEQALSFQTRDRMPFEWANVQSNVGNTNKVLGVLTEDLSVLDSAVEAFEASLEERTFDKSPRSWAATKLELGKTHLEIGKLQVSRKTVETGKAIVVDVWETFRDAGFDSYDAFFAAEIAQFDQVLAEL